MKKISAFVIAFLLIAYSFASSDAKPRPLKASDVRIPVAAGVTITLEDLATMKPADYAKLSGRKMKFFDRVGFRIAQKKLRNSINPDGTLNNRKLEKTFRKAGDGTTGFHLGGFALGLFVGLIGVLIAYLINDEKKSNRVKWAWIGLGVYIVILIIILAA